ncbi:snRNA-activating protein complex subunit 1-like [Homalodisca vitripennis]|uniref:snRNA-activating protein complex subunit 1-like n=1 Tax=Homalodisca vitripennis TaxID=197043 RepID=UPI001EEAA502|nr:snRNA-activating protein complex subunit 1-like [Homalodisca vitripennis]
MVVPLNQVYTKMVTDFRNDCENLIDKFKEKLSDDFRDFVPLWKSFKFNLVYEKYSKFGLNYDFKEDSLQIAKTIMLNDYFVGGIFLLYGLYFVQEDPKASIRLELYEYEKLLKLIKDERKTLIDTCQPGYLFAKLLKNNAFAFVRFSRDFSMEGQNRSRVIFSGQPIVMNEVKTFDDKSWLQGFLSKIDFIQDLKKVEQDYFKKKQKLKDDHPELNLALDMMPDDIVDGMMKNLVQPLSQEKNNEKTESIGSRRKMLKGRRMKIRHRYAGNLLETQSSAITPSLPVREMKRKGAPRGKVKHYFKSLVNDPSESDESINSETDDCLLNLPDI